MRARTIRFQTSLFPHKNCLNACIQAILLPRALSVFHVIFAQFVYYSRWRVKLFIYTRRVLCYSEFLHVCSEY